METSAPSEDTAAALVVDEVPPAVTSAPATIIENAATAAPVVDTAPSAVSSVPVAVDRVESVVPVAEVVNDADGSCNSAPVEDDKLNEAMASTTISTADSTDLKQNHSEAIIEELVSDTTAEESVIVDNNIIVKTLVSEKALSEPDEATDGEFENTSESIDKEDENVERVQQCDISQQECLSNGDSTGEEDLGDEEGVEPEVPGSVLPVPVDIDTNDPQYIPRRGRFYEHDDRMAYSTTSSEESELGNGHEQKVAVVIEGSDHQLIKKQHTDSKNTKLSTTPVETAENNSTEVVDSTPSSSKVLASVLAISKAEVPLQDSLNNANASDVSAKKPGGGFKKSRNIDGINKWSHDMYKEYEQTPKSRDELVVSYGYDIRVESEAPRARRHHKYGRSATAKYTRSWQDTKAYTGTGGPQSSSKVKRFSVSQRLDKYKAKSSNSDECTSEQPSLDGKKMSESSSTTVAATETSEVIVVLSQRHDQQINSVPQEKKTVVSASKTNPTHNYFARTPIKKSSENPSNHQDQKNGTPQSSFHNKNYYVRPSTDSPVVGKEKKPSQINHDNPSIVANPNLFKRKPQQSGVNIQQNNSKQQNINSQGQNQHHSSPTRSRNFHQQTNNNQQFNRDRYFAKGSVPPSSSNSNNDQQNHNSEGPTSAGTGRTRHSGGNQNQHNNRKYANENDKNERSIQQMIIRSSKRYSVQSRKEISDAESDINHMTPMTNASQLQQPSVSHHQQHQNGLVMQDQQQVIQQLQSQQQQPIQIHQQQPPPMQIQQYHQPIQQIHPHHGMVLDHNTGMMVMAAADPSMYHQLYAAPQYATAVPSGPTAVADDQNAAAVAAAALQMLAAQAAVYQPIPTGATGVTPPTTGSQSLQQQPETFMTTYYQPQQQPQQQPPPRRINLAIPIVAPPAEHIQQGTSKTSLSPTPPPNAV